MTMRCNEIGDGSYAALNFWHMWEIQGFGVSPISVLLGFRNRGIGRIREVFHFLKMNLKKRYVQGGTPRQPNPHRHVHDQRGQVTRCRHDFIQAPDTQSRNP